MNTQRLIHPLAHGLRLLFAVTLVASTVMAVALPVAAAARPAAGAVAQQATLCADGAQSCYGDLDTVPDGAGSEDDFTTYSQPSDFDLWAQATRPGGNPLTNSDEPVGPGNKVYPFILRGHRSFNPSTVRTAILRVEFYFAVVSSPGSDTIRFWDEQNTAGDYATGYRFGLRVHDLLNLPQYRQPPDCIPDPASRNCARPQWIRLDIDLTTGFALAYEFDPVTHTTIRDYGRLGPKWPESTFDFERGLPQDVVRLAADGTLYGVVEDDVTLSYVSLIIDADPLPPVCPTMLDNFNRANGRLRTPWRGAEGRPNYRIANQQLDPGSGGPIFWPTVFGVDQTACVTLARVDPNGVHQSLLLKIRGDWRQGAIAVFYNAMAGEVGIETFVPGRGWLTLETVSIPIADGDQLGARAMPNGKVIAYVNDAPVLETTVEPIFHNRTGQIGLWFIAAADALLDDFSGGTIP